MDPKSASALDPKLKEVYDRVMGTSLSKPPVIPPPPPTPNMPGVTSVQTPLSSSPGSPATAASVPQTATPSPSPTRQAGQSAIGLSPSISANQTTAPQTSKPVSPPLASTGGSVNKSAVDYSALAGNASLHANPVSPSQQAAASPQSGNTMYTQQEPQRIVTPSTVTYGVVNDQGVHKQATSTSNEHHKNGFMKIVLLFIGIPTFIIVYTVVWVMIFGIDLSQFLSI